MSIAGRARGAVLVETTISIMSWMLFLIGSFALFTTGYGQLAADGLAFERALALSGHADYVMVGGMNAFNSPAGLQKSLDYTFDSTLLNSKATPVDQGNANPIPFSYNGGPSPYLNPYGVSAQYTGPLVGGASYVRLGIETSQYKVTNIAGIGPLLGGLFPTTATGAVIEPIAVAVNTGLGLSAVPPDSPTWYQNPQAHDWIEQQNVNLMPFFLSHQIDYVCADDYEFPSGPDCLNHHGRLESYGVAEYLDADNYGKAPGVGPNEAFNAMLLHQRCFASLLTGPNALPAVFPVRGVGYLPATAPDFLAGTSGTLPTNLQTLKNPVLVTMYRLWDVPQPTDNGGRITAANKPHPLSTSGC